MQDVTSVLLPIVVGVDGQLLKSRVSDELVFQAFREKPWRVVQLALGGGLDASVAQQATADVPHWPVNEELVDYLQEAAQAGQEIVLATDVDAAIAKAFADRFTFVSRVIQLPPGSAGAEKARLLRAEFPKGFIYAGNAAADLDVWAHAAGAISVGAPARVVQQLSLPHEVLPSQRLGFTALRKTLRLHQWAKNLLIFVPLVLAGKQFDISAWLGATMGFFALGLVASGTYIINDLMDLNSDRRHWHKRYRPLARGTVSLRAALPLAAGCLAVGLGLAVMLGGAALLMIGLYLAVTLSYSLYWKRIPIFDVTVLAALYTIRLGLGIVVTSAAMSSWLLVFSMFIFLSLSLAKRHTEALRMADQGTISTGRGYRPGDAPITLGLGLSSAMAAVLIMVVFLSEDVFNRPQYAVPQLLWVFPPVLFLFLGRVWLLTQRGEMHDDPVAFALKDRTSVLLGALMGVALVLALLGPKLW